MPVLASGRGRRPTAAVLLLVVGLWTLGVLGAVPLTAQPVLPAQPAVAATTGLPAETGPKPGGHPLGSTVGPWRSVSPPEVRSALAGPSGSIAAAAGPRAGFVLPVPPPPVVLTPFRPPAVKWGAGHRGVDLAAAAGQPVLAAADGVVAFAGTVVDRGVVSVGHSPALRTTYEPLTPGVRVGQRVRAGQVIGTLAAGHGSCAPRDCLHWGARIGADTYLDPMALINGLRIRLKPWDGAEQ